MRAPLSLMAPSPEATIDDIIGKSSLAPKYSQVVDRESAYEMLNKKLSRAAPPEPTASKRQAKGEPSMVEQVLKSSVFKSMLRSAGTVVGREITRSLFGTARRR